MNILDGLASTNMTPLYPDRTQYGNTPKKIVNVAIAPCPTFEQHQGLVTQSFVKSGVDNWLRSGSFEFVADTAIDPNGDSVFPIHEFLDWKITRFGHQARSNVSALLISNDLELLF